MTNKRIERVDKRIERKVESLLAKHKLDRDLPVEIDRFAEALGVDVVERADLKLDGKPASGVLFRADGRSICVLNQDDSTNRRRFSLAHELGHFALHPLEESHVDHAFRVYARDDRSSEGVITEEIEANAFAAALLMPRQEVYSRLRFPLSAMDDEQEIRDLAREFGVSTQAMVVRLTNLDLIK